MVRLRTRVTATQEKEKKIYQKMFSQDNKIKKTDSVKNEKEIGEDEGEEEEEEDVSIFKSIIC